jgi:hypothetical protein
MEQVIDNYDNEEKGTIEKVQYNLPISIKKFLID